MSYDISLVRDGKSVEVPSFEEGGTRLVGGTDKADLNITYNYAWFYYHFLDKRKGIRWLYGRTGSECVSRLERAVGMLGTRKFDDYWAPTPGNAGYALNILLQWAKQHPDAVFEGD